MRRGLRKSDIRAAVLLGSVLILTGCQKDTGAMQAVGQQENSISEGLPMEDRKGCPLGELFTYLEEEGAGIPYAYAKVYINCGDANEENTEEAIENSGEEDTGGFQAAFGEGETEESQETSSEGEAEESQETSSEGETGEQQETSSEEWTDEFSDDFYDEYRQDIVRIEGAADISWQTFENDDEFQAYFAMQEQETEQSFMEEKGYEIAFVYYQYQLPEGIHVDEMNRFLKERYDEEDNPLYAITLSRRPDQGTYCFSQSNEREIVIMDNIAYGLECKSIVDENVRDDIRELLTAYSTQKQKVKTYDGWVMSEETLYWTDHDERITSLENPTRVFTEVKGIDTNWSETPDMENFALLKEADYQIKIWEDGPLLQIHFEFAEEIPEGGYEIYLCNGFCADKDYEMTVVNTDTNELLQSRKVQMSVELPDMITFADLDGDGYLDMQIDEPTHWSGERAVVDEYSWHTYMLWNVEENGFETASEDEIAVRLAQNQNQTKPEIEIGEEREAETAKEKAAVYVVVPGDTLWGISRRFYGTGTRYTEIEERNVEVLSGHKYLMPGMELRILD